MNKSIMVTFMAALLVVGIVINADGEVPSSIEENVPGTMNYQGLLVQPNGTPYTDGTYTFDIRLYTDPNAGTAIWGGTYSSYVKDGYFNIMLGAEGGAVITAAPVPTYTHNQLWKALWPDPSNGNPGDSLYLSVTPWQDEVGNPITEGSRVEFTPRQTLMTAPYAFRAQTADSANRADGDFTVAGRVTAADLTLDGTLLGTTDDYVYVGGPDGNTAVNHVNINAADVDIDAGVSDLRMTSTDSVYVNADNDILMDSADETIIEADGYLKMSGNVYAQVTSASGAVYLHPSTEVRGTGPLKWRPPGYISSYYNPIRLKKFNMSIASGNTYATYDTGIVSSSFACSIVGLSDVNHSLQCFYMYQSGGSWIIRVDFDESAAYTDGFYVHVMQIDLNFVDDQR